MRGLRRPLDAFNGLNIRLKLTLIFFTVLISTSSMAVTNIFRETTTNISFQINEQLENGMSAVAGVFDAIQAYTMWTLDGLVSMPQVHQALRGIELETAWLRIYELFGTPAADDFIEVYETIVIFDADNNVLINMPEIPLEMDFFTSVEVNLERASEGLPWLSAFVSFENAVGSGKMIFTRPVIADGEFLGTVALISSTAMLYNFLHIPMYDYGGFVNIADSSGTIFFSSRDDYMGVHIDALGVYETLQANYEFDEAIREIPLNTVFIYESAITNVAKTAYVRQYSNFDLIIMIFFDHTAIENAIISSVLSVVPVSGGMLLIMVAVILLINRILKPLKDLTTAARLFAKGIPPEDLNVSASDEISEAYSSFKEITKSINLLEEHFKKAENAMNRGDLLYRLDEPRLGGIYRGMLNNANKIIEGFQNLFELIVEPVFIINANYELKYANKRAINLTGRNHYKGMKVNAFVGGDLEGLIQESMESGNTVENIYAQFPLDLTQMFDIEIGCIPFKADEKCALIIFNNITHIKDLQRSLEANSREKTNFLAIMSHEIRTPLNAIIGIAEIVLREETSNTVQNYVNTIRQSGNHLLSIINDILDFTKIESGRMDILEEEYLIESVVQDVISITQMRMTDAPVDFYVYMSTAIPYKLIGDSLRLRQILLNILINAVKYTENGYITLDLNWKDGNIVTRISDTGIGIKEEDIGGLFEEFNKFDLEKNRNVEGTGLGLPITKKLVGLMHGEIEVESEYGNGTTFTVTIPQKCVADLEDWNGVLEDKNILIYSASEICAEYTKLAMRDLHINYLISNNAEEVSEELKKVWDFLIVEEENSLRNIDIGDMDESQIVILGDKNHGEGGFIRLTQPIFFTSILNLFKNPDEESNKYKRTFSTKDAKVLVVDDIETNLTVCAGLLNIYGVEPDLCSSGEDAIKAVQATDYDIVFMDHMMPEMDGIETTRAIRALGTLGKESFRKLPIIALTANATTTARDKMLKNGLNDFVAKPIELNKLKSILVKWLPTEKQIQREQQNIEQSDVLKIKDIDTKRGIISCGGKVEQYKNVLTVFCNDVQNKVIELRENVGNIKLYTIYVHAIKSASANIGAFDLSNLAEELEKAGMRLDREFIAARNETLIEKMEETFVNISAVLLQKQVRNQDISEIQPNLTALIQALSDFDVMAIDEICEELAPFKDNSIVENILQKILIGSYEDAAKAAKEAIT
ncbi:MAG: ATP-binding protein [Turicibacter sp.]|nr:ATP-binding protein [Turicibacter sp.]